MLLNISFLFVLMFIEIIALLRLLCTFSAGVNNCKFLSIWSVLQITKPSGITPLIASKTN